MSNTTKITDEVDVALIGAGVMSATLGAILRELEPNWTQAIFERLDAPAQESSYPWNNAGTGHSALCELNYTPEKNGKIDITKAVGINEKFQLSRQFWAHQVETGQLGDPKEFINPIPHVSLAQGEEQVRFLRHRYEVLSSQPLFPGMQFSDDDAVFQEKLPLMSEGRDFSNKVAVSWTNVGTDINYGALTKQFLDNATKQGTVIRYGSEVTKIKADGKKWKVHVKNVHTGDQSVVRANFVFVGAGGYALDLLRTAGIPEVRGIAGFPVSGMWLRCTNPELIKQHHAKVYGKAVTKNAPPMSVPHLDTRVIDGETGLLFGPFGGWSPKFLKKARTWIFSSPFARTTSRLIWELRSRRWILRSTSCPKFSRISTTAWTLCANTSQMLAMKTGRPLSLVSACRLFSRHQHHVLARSNSVPRWSTMLRAPSQACSVRPQEHPSLRPR